MYFIINGIKNKKPNLNILLTFCFKYSNFREVCKLAVERAQQLPKQHLVLFWHHSLLEAYKYLDYIRM
jgi:hypothetical protein